MTGDGGDGTTGSGGVDVSGCEVGRGGDDGLFEVVGETEAGHLVGSLAAVNSKGRAGKD